MTSIDRALIDLATRNHGLIHRREAHALGATDRRLRHRVDCGWLVQCGKHVFRLSGSSSTPIAQLRALVRDLSDDGFASGPTAAALHGFDGWRLIAPFDVTIVRDRNMRRIGHRIHTTKELPLIDRDDVQGCRTLSPARTLIDLARTECRERLAVAFDSGLRDGLLSEDLLHRRIVALRGSGRIGISKLLEVVEGHEVVSGGHSWLEREFLRVVDAAGLARPLTQQVLSRTGDRLVRVDVRFPGTNVVVELLGYRHHRTAAQMSRDAERQNALLRDGFLPYSFTYRQVVDEPDRVVAEVVAALIEHRLAG